MLRLDWLVSQFPSQYFSKLPGFNLWKLTWFSGVFPPMGGHIIQKWYECSIDDQDHDRYDWVFRSVVENEDLYGWDYRLINENHDRYYLNRFCILETQSLWSKEIDIQVTKSLAGIFIIWVVLLIKRRCIPHISNISCRLTIEMFLWNLSRYPKNFL